MTRCQFWTEVIPYYRNARDAIMYRFLFGQYCNVLQDNNISEELSNVRTYLGDCDCCNCRRRANTIYIAAPSSVDSSDSLFALSNRFSYSIERSWQSQAVPTSPSHFSDSESWITSDSKDIEVSQQHNESFVSIFVESKSFSVDEELDLDYHCQCLSDGEHIFNQPLSESVGSSLANAETQCSNDYFGTPYPKLVDACFSDAETQPSIYFKDELPSAAGVLSCSDTETQLLAVVDGLPSLKLLETSFSWYGKDVLGMFILRLELTKCVLFTAHFLYKDQPVPSVKEKTRGNPLSHKIRECVLACISKNVPMQNISDVIGSICKNFNGQEIDTLPSVASIHIISREAKAICNKQLEEAIKNSDNLAIMKDAPTKQGRQWCKKWQYRRIHFR
ncbi:unnamed protein product [Mytilus coruscus]|uniref:BEN domain-containing protein n=1 Tax=Mytilus coruscus TaxID=42192 RepID=A0A6J8AD92_MYTCO|nr:unnamed protein product [Mytilus coruscus]